MMHSVVSSELMWSNIHISRVTAGNHSFLQDEVFISFVFWKYHVNLRNLKKRNIFLNIFIYFF